MLHFIEKVVKNLLQDWLRLTTHRLDIYNEELAKTEFLERSERLFYDNNADTTALGELPTAYDYIRLGHPLSSVLEWTIAKLNNLNPDHVISFSSNVTPVLAILRKNLFENKSTLITYTDKLPVEFDAETLRGVYGYTFELKQVQSVEDVPEFEGTTIFISQQNEMDRVDLPVDFVINTYENPGSIIQVLGEQNKKYISEIQHVRRRETIAMTPANCLSVLKMLLSKTSNYSSSTDYEHNKSHVLDSIREITASKSKALIGSSGLSIQYAITMGLIDDAMANHPGKTIKIVIPPNCYGGTNDHARRVTACLDHVEVEDLPVDGDNDMVQSIDKVLNKVAEEDAIPYIIVEIPTNPRVEVPDIEKLQEVLSKKRNIPNGSTSIDPVFILDQTFCPNIQFLKEDGILSSVRSISYVSGSKFPSGGKCTAGYCVANEKAEGLMDRIEKHLQFCDNEATDLQIEILAERLPSMNQRIDDANKNTREFVNFIKEKLPAAKINFVSEALAQEGFTPSVFSLDLPTKGNTGEERESYKRALNNQLIN